MEPPEEEVAPSTINNLSPTPPAWEYLRGLIFNALWPAPYKKSITLDYPDFTLRQFELHSPSSEKALVVHGHGRLRSPVHKIYETSFPLDFYTEIKQVLETTHADLHRFQTRRSHTPPVETIQPGEDSADYEISHSPAFDDVFAGLLYHSQLFNRKREITSTADLEAENYHDVLIVKPGKTLTLSNALKQLPRYNRIHCMFCRTR